MTGGVTGWVKLLCKQYAFGVKIKSICKKKGFGLIKNGGFWWLGKNKKGNCNFTVSCGDESFCVKLIGVRSKRILFGFIDENHFEIKDYTFAILHTMDSFEYEVRNKEPYRFAARSVPCIVMVSESAKVTVRHPHSSNIRTEIGSGDTAPEGCFYFENDFLQMLKEK